MTLDRWIDSFRDRFEAKSQGLEVHKALIQLQLKDTSTGVIELHNLEYTSKEAENLQLQRH